MRVDRIIQGTLQDGPNGWSDVWQFFVCDIGGNENTRRWRAMTAPRIPQKNEAHPDGIPGVRVTTVTADYDQLDPDQVIVTVEFGGESDGHLTGLEGTGIKNIDVSTSTLSVTGTRDYLGRQMIVTYSGVEFTIPGTTGGAFFPGTEAQTVAGVTSKTLTEAEYDLSTTTVVVTKEMPFPSHLESRRVAMRTNADSWSGLGPHQWLCLGIDSNENQAGAFDWRYIFAIAPDGPDNDTWRFRSEGQELLLRDPILGTDSQGQPTSDGRLPIRFDASVGNGIEFFHVYEPFSFLSRFGFQIPGR